MLRVIDQERHYDAAWSAWLTGHAGKKDRTFGDMLTRLRLGRTPPDAEDAQRTRELDLQRVRQKLGRFYRPPIQA